MFDDRNSAADLLALKLKSYKNQKPVVAAIPRGAVPMGKKIADFLRGDLTAVLVHKIPAPGNEEFAIGCVGVSGNYQLSSYAKKEHIPESYIKMRVKEFVEILQERQRQYHLDSPPFKDRVVIIVDDGIATGATTKCAVAEVRSYSPKKIILATPVASSEASEELRGMVDEFIALYIPRMMFSIGEFYKNFPQVSDREVLNIFQGNKGDEDIFVW